MYFYFYNLKAQILKAIDPIGVGARERLPANRTLLAPRRWDAVNFTKFRALVSLDALLVKKVPTI